MRLAACLGAVLGAAIVAAGAQAQISPEQARAIAGDPPFVQQSLRLVDIPAATGRAVALLNGRDLRDWETWLGYGDPSLTYLDKPGAKPLGPGGDMFKMVEIDGAPALYVNGKTWGSIVHKKNFSNYHLRLEYKWGEKRYAPRLDQPHNNGLLYHSGGVPGSVYGTWMPAVEFEIMLGSVGMVVPVGTHIGVRTSVGYDPKIIYPHRRFMIGGRTLDVAQPAWNVEAASNPERPAGAWNVIDLYVLGDRAIHVLNGVPVMEVHDLSILDRKTGKRSPLTSGRIQFQSEGAETYFRNVTLEPIAALPRIVQD
ncbi:DUF1080 domain-containing protein [Sphingosinicella sp. BN140058]|uniref:3-keto-disaccharide hydrolase n=1 Tax=Sphingosinicella sp. BN140058 TaxID=1892855 RepID=UPI0010125459|nr:DUF1080 domain-containing protein [Sphingosinicella sp. BN140058]QAY77500.1 DUF1080 domain-containing protein [Sphingosinicella sp. BN140058]